MSSEPVVPLNNTEKEQESPYVAPGTDRELGHEENVLAAKTDRLLEPESRSPEISVVESAQPTAGLRGTAETVGSAVGRAVNRARDLPRRLAEMKERFTVISGRAQEDAATVAQEAGESAKIKVEQARVRIQHYAREYPVQFILGVGTACFVFGAFLRIWRSSRRG